MLSEKCFVVFYVFSFPAGVYVWTLNLIASNPDSSILTLNMTLQALKYSLSHLENQRHLFVVVHLISQFCSCRKNSVICRENSVIICRQ